jgi:hypothetical protein
MLAWLVIRGKEALWVMCIKLCGDLQPYSFTGERHKPAGHRQNTAEWIHGGYREIQQPPKRYRIIDIPALRDLGGFNDIATMQQQLRQWLIEELTINNSVRDKTWSESLAAGSEDCSGQL